MHIKLPHMPFRFNSPEGQMEITVRSGAELSDGNRAHRFGAAVTFLQPGPKALVRIPLAVRAGSHREAMLALTEGFKVTIDSRDKESVEHRVLTALCRATGVVELHT
jgi:hypothetical protein